MSLYEVARRSFVPYDDNGGTVVAVAGNDYCVVAADTRLSIGINIGTRCQKRLFRLSPVTVLGATGCWADIITLARLVQTQMRSYEYEHGKPMSTGAAAQMLSTMLYYKRFFPYYSVTLLAGLDSDGKGTVYNFDPVGHYECSRHSAIGSARNQLQPVLDNQVCKKNMLNVTDAPYPKEKALDLVQDLFTAAAERDTHTGDSVNIITISRNSFNEKTFALRRD